MAWGRIAPGAQILLPIVWKKGALRSIAGTRRLAGLAIGFIGIVALPGTGSVHGLTAWAVATPTPGRVISNLTSSPA